MNRTLLAAALLMAGCVAPAAVETANNPPPIAGVDADGFAPKLYADGFVFGYLNAVADPTLSLHMETYLPEGAADGDKFPTVLVASPYFGAGQMGEAPGHPVYGWLVKDLVPRGYAVVLADTAGTGGSSGCWDFMGPNEVRGVKAMIEEIAAQPWSDGQVGMIGKSYDGMTQIMAMTQEIPALKTVVPVAPLTHAYAGLFMNGVHYGGGWHLTTTSYHQISAAPPVGAQERYPGYAVRTIETPTCIGQNTLLGNDPTGSYNAYFVERDFRPLAKDVQASVFFMQGFLDPAVKPDNTFPFFTDVPTPKKAWLGHWAHDYANATWAGREDMFVTLHRWFDHELKGIDNGMDAELGVDVQDSLGRWRREATWPPADATPLALTITPDATLTTGEAAEGRLAFGGPDSLLALRDGAPKNALRIEGEPLATDVHIAGIPKLHLVLKTATNQAYVVARLLEVNDSGERMISQGALSLAYPDPQPPGAAWGRELQLYPTDHVVRAGSRLVLQLQTVDERQWFDPDPTLATVELVLTPDLPTILELPTIVRSEADVFLVACGSRIKEIVPECYQEGRIDIGVSG